MILSEYDLWLSFKISYQKASLRPAYLAAIRCPEHGLLVFHKFDYQFSLLNFSHLPALPDQSQQETEETGQKYPKRNSILILQLHDAHAEEVERESNGIGTHHEDNSEVIFVVDD